MDISSRDNSRHACCFERRLQPHVVPVLASPDHGLHPPPQCSRPQHRLYCPSRRSVLSDSYRTPLHIMHPPHVVALGALCLAATITQLDLRAWLNGLDADFAAVGALLRLAASVGALLCPASVCALLWLAASVCALLCPAASVCALLCLAACAVLGLHQYRAAVMSWCAGLSWVEQVLC